MSDPQMSRHDWIIDPKSWAIKSLIFIDWIFINWLLLGWLKSIGQICKIQHQLIDYILHYRLIRKHPFLIFLFWRFIRIFFFWKFLANYEFFLQNLQTNWSVMIDRPRWYWDWFFLGFLLFSFFEFYRLIKTFLDWWPLKILINYRLIKNNCFLYPSHLMPPGHVVDRGSESWLFSRLIHSRTSSPNPDHSPKTA